MKTKNKIMSLMFIGTLALASCMKDPMACVDSPTKTGTTGQPISFDASCSMDAMHYEWEFGDGTKAEGATVTHAYSAVGTYTAKVKAMSKDMKKESEKTITVTVN